MTWTRSMRLLLPWVVGLFILSSCANELSEEKKRRELSDRDYQRLAKAAGTFTGYLEAGENRIVPASVQITVQKNPTQTGEKPSLIVALKLGFVGNVTVKSTSAAFDWGTKELTASFARPSRVATAALEIRAKVQEDTLVDPILIGASQGALPLKLARYGASLFTEEEQSTLSFQIADKDGKFSTKSDGVLVLKRQKIPSASPATSDLPLFPGLDASIRLDPLGITPQVARSVLYDPMRGTLDLYLTETSRLEFTDVFQNAPTATKGVPLLMKGTLNLGGHRLREVRARSEDLTPPTVRSLPPGTYLGIFQGSPTSLAFKAVAYIDYQGSAGLNTLEFPFPLFPNLRMDIIICMGNDDFQRSNLRLDVVDYMNRRVLFRNLVNPGVNPLELFWTDGWAKLEGTYLKTSETRAGDRPRLTLSARPSENFKGCEETW